MAASTVWVATTRSAWSGMASWSLMRRALRLSAESFRSESVCFVTIALRTYCSAWATEAKLRRFEKVAITASCTRSSASLGPASIVANARRRPCLCAPNSWSIGSQPVIGTPSHLQGRTCVAFRLGRGSLGSSMRRDRASPLNGSGWPNSVARETTSRRSASTAAPSCVATPHRVAASPQRCPRSRARGSRRRRLRPGARREPFRWDRRDARIRATR